MLTESGSVISRSIAHILSCTMIGAILFVHRLSYKLHSFWQLWIWAVVSSDRVKRVDEICAKGILYMHLVFDFRIFLFIDWHMVMYTANYLAESYNVIYHHRTQGRSQPHSSGWARVPLSTLFLKFWLIFLIFPQILVISSLFWPSGWASRPPGKALATALMKTSHDSPFATPLLQVSNC